MHAALFSYFCHFLNFIQLMGNDLVFGTDADHLDLVHTDQFPFNDGFLCGSDADTHAPLELCPTEQNGFNGEQLMAPLDRKSVV